MKGITQTVLIVVTVILTAPGLAGASPIIFDDGPIDSANHRFFAAPGPDRRSTVVFKRVGKREKERLWEAPTWSPAEYLTNDGEYLVTGYAGSNLLEHHYDLDEAMVSFYRRGTLINTVRLREIIRDTKHLEPSDDGVQWGFFVGLIGPTRFALDTVEHRRFIYDVTNGTVVDVKSTPPSSMVPPARRP